MATNRNRHAGVFKDIKEYSSDSSSDNEFSSSSTDSGMEKSYLMTSSILLKFADRSSNAGQRPENWNMHQKPRRRSRHSQSVSSIHDKRRKSHRKEMGVSLDLSATILKLHKLQMARECDKLPEASSKKNSHGLLGAISQRVYSTNGHRLSIDNSTRSQPEHPRSRHSVSEPHRKANTKLKLKTQGLRLSRSPRNSHEEPQHRRVLPPVIGVICSSPTAQCDGYFSVPHYRSSASLSPRSLTPLSSTSPGNSSIDLRSAISLTPTSRSESDESHSPLPSLRNAPKLGRKKLPPIIGMNSSSESIHDLNLQSDLKNPLSKPNKNLAHLNAYPGDSGLDFSSFSMKSISRSGSEDTSLPLPPLQRTPKMGKRTLPPIKRNDSANESYTGYESTTDDCARGRKY